MKVTFAAIKMVFKSLKINQHYISLVISMIYKTEWSRTKI